MTSSGWEIEMGGGLRKFWNLYMCRPGVKKWDMPIKIMFYVSTSHLVSPAACVRRRRSARNFSKSKSLYKELTCFISFLSPTPPRLTCTFQTPLPFSTHDGPKFSQVPLPVQRAAYFFQISFISPYFFIISSYFSIFPSYFSIFPSYSLHISFLFSWYFLHFPS